MSAHPRSVALMVGSLRPASLNRRLAAAVTHELAPDLAVLEVPIAGLPHYDPRLDGEARPPEVVAFIDSLAASDALVVVTPMYNLSIPGPLKNAIDWASRPAFAGPLVGTPAAVLAVSPSERSRPTRVVEETNLVLQICLAEVMVEPVVALGRGKELFDDSEQVVDPEARAELAGWAAAFRAHVESVIGGSPGNS